MFKTASNKEIGEYISKLIYENNKFKSGRDFCKKYLKLVYGVKPSDEEIQKQANRLSGIKSGKFGIQINDLEYYTQLLEVTCEELLSAGESKPPFPDRYSNYNFAHSTEEKYWKKYIDNEDKIFLNADEYGKTVLDYALEFENLKLIKFLMQNHYLTIVDNESTNDYGMTFLPPHKAYQNIARNTNKLSNELVSDDTVRTNIVTLAIKNNDNYFLTKLRAREIPALYHLCDYSASSQLDNYESCYNSKLTAAVAKSGKEVLDYFSDAFNINSEHDEAVFIYPFLGRLLDKMIAENNKNTVYVLKRALNYNKNVLNELSEKITQLYILYKKYCDDDEAFSGAVRYFDMNSIGAFSFIGTDPSDPSKCIKMKSNVVHINEVSDDSEISKLIDGINQVYYDVKNLNKQALLKVD